MTFKSLLKAMACTAVMLISASAVVAQTQENSPTRTAGLTYSKDNLTAVVLHNVSDSAVHTDVEALDGVGQVIGLIPEAGDLNPGETKSIAVAAVPDGTAGIRVTDPAIELTLHFDAGNGQFVELRALDGQVQPTQSEDTTAQSANVERPPSLMSPHLTSAASSNISTCGGLTSSGNPFPCNNGGNCVWFAWKMASDRWGIDFPARGNANTWLNSATSNLFRVFTTPATDTIAVNTIQKDSTGAVTGHVGWVTSASGNTVCTQEMSWGVWGMKTVCRDRSYWNGFVYAPTITLTSPNSPSVVWTSNSTQWVSWNYTGTPGAVVRIELVKPAVLQGNDLVWVLASSVSIGSRGNGSALVKVPLVPLRGGGYYIRVTSVSVPRYWGASNWLFTVR